MSYESGMIARNIVLTWWSTQDQLIPTIRNQSPLMLEISDAIDAARTEGRNEGRAEQREADAKIAHSFHNDDYDSSTCLQIENAIRNQPGDEKA